MVEVMPDDMTLLQEYALRNSEEAFATLVSRYVNLVYSVALRDVRDPHLAEEITQVVFIILARKAGSLGSKVILSGWLCRTARYASANALTIQRRRQQREQEAYMQSMLNQSEPDAWTQIAPLLGAAMEQLGQKDHDAIVLRFFEGKSFLEIGTAFGASENAAKKRVAYALEKLRKYFSKRGVALPVSVITAAMANSVQAAPAVLAKTATAVAIAKGATAPGSTLTIMKGALKVMAWSNAKAAIVAGAILLAVGGGTAVYEVQQNPHSADAPAEMKVKWPVGKKYEMHLELNQNTETESPDGPQPVAEGLRWTQDFNISTLKELPDGGRQLELEFVDEAIEESQSGQTVLSFDTSQSPAENPHNPLAILKAMIGSRLEYLTDTNGKVQKIEGVKELAAHIAAVGTPEQQRFFNQTFNEGALKRYLAFADVMPNRMIRVGESWPAKQDYNDSIGVTTLSMKFTFKNWEQYGDRRCAHIEGTGNLSSKSVSNASGALIEIEKGKISADLRFDPELGMAVTVDENEDLKLKITTRTETKTQQTHNKVHVTLTEVP